MVHTIVKVNRDLEVIAVAKYSDYFDAQARYYKALLGQMLDSGWKYVSGVDPDNYDVISDEYDEYFTQESPSYTYHIVSSWEIRDIDYEEAWEEIKNELGL